MTVMLLTLYGAVGYSSLCTHPRFQAPFMSLSQHQDRMQGEEQRQTKPYDLSPLDPILILEM